MYDDFTWKRTIFYSISVIVMMVAFIFGTDSCNGCVIDSHRAEEQARVVEVERVRACREMCNGNAIAYIPDGRDNGSYARPSMCLCGGTSEGAVVAPVESQ